MIYDNGLIPTITRPTRITTSTATLIDNIITDYGIGIKSRSGILEDDTSDHLPCFAVIPNINPCRREEVKITSRDIRKKNMDALKSKLNNTPLLSPNNTGTLDERFDTFHTELQRLINHFLPIGTRTITRSALRREPWVTPGLLISIRKCKLLYRRHIKDARDINKWNKYREYNKHLKRIKRAAKKKYYYDKCEEHKHNTKNLWKTINSVTKSINNKTEVIEKLKVDGGYIHSGEEISEEFAAHFAGVGKKYATQMTNPKNDLRSYVDKIPMHAKSIFLEPVTAKEIEKHIDNLPPKKSSGIDNIDNTILKELKQYLVGPLTTLFNDSIEYGVFPSAMKTVKVIPLFKNKAKEETTNYRPISLLLTISKILEKTMYTRVYTFLTTTKQLYVSQYGFRKKHGCDHAVGELIANISKGIEQGKLTTGIFLDLSKAFDSLEHTAIFMKMERYGLRGICLEWFKSYLKDRKLQVSCRTADTGTTTTSNLHSVEYGTAQGSCLGPLIFLIFCNDLQMHLKFLNCIQFADDTTLYVTHSNINYIRFCLEHDLLTLQDWFLANKLTLNIGKSICILFGKHNGIILNIKLGNTSIPQAKTTKFLGMWIDQDLTWNDHVNKLILKLKSRINLLRNGKNFLTTHALRLIYYAQIHSNMSYGISLWGSLLNQEMSLKLQKIQTTGVNIVARKRALPMDYKQLKILTLPQMVKLEMCKLWHKKTLNLLPQKLNEAMSTDHHNRSLTKDHQYNTRQKGLANRPLAKKREYHNSFLVSGNRLYTSLSPEIRNSPNIEKFAKDLKAYLLNTN